MAQSLNVLPQLTRRPWQHCARGWLDSAEDTALFPVCLTGDAGTVFPPFSGSGVLKAIGNATSLHDSLAAAATIGQGLSAWSKQQQATIEALQPVAERIGKNLISEIPDLASLSAADSYSWLSAIHPGAHITLPGK